MQNSCAACGLDRRDGQRSGYAEISDCFTFLLEWFRNPSGTAAIAPSGRALTELITRGVNPATGPVLELGPGTGVFTYGLLARGVAEENLTLVEQNPGFANVLSDRFPRATVLSGDAANIAKMSPANSRSYGAAICGLGFRNMSVAQIDDVLRAAFSCLREDAPLYMFTYGRRCSVPSDVLEELGLTAERIGTTLRNLPPASVFRLGRNSASI